MKYFVCLVCLKLGYVVSYLPIYKIALKKNQNIFYYIFNAYVVKEICVQNLSVFSSSHI